MEEVKVEKLLGQTEEQTKDEYKNFALAKVKKKFVFSLLKGGLSSDAVKEAIVNAQNSGYNSILALPSYISHIARAINSDNLKVGVVIDYPFGENTLEGTLCQIKKWAKSSVDEIVVVLPLSDIKFNKCKNSEKILKNLYSISKKKAVSVMYDAYKLNDNELLKITKEIIDYRISTAYISTAIYKEKIEDRAIEVIKSTKKGQNPKICYSGEIENFEQATALLEKCDYILTDKASEFIEEIKNKIEI